MRTCKRCDKPHAARGYCDTHYKYAVAHGHIVTGPKTVADRLEAHIARVPIAGCWIWIGALGPKGYGSINFEGAMRSAHRVAYRVWVGPIPEGLDVLHRCDVRPCINPAHLYAGSHAQNMRDMADRMRSMYGERHRDAILTEQQVLAIRSSPMGARRLARIYGVAVSTIGHAKSGRSWKHLPMANAA